jgi:hypothetical protein
MDRRSRIAGKSWSAAYALAAACLAACSQSDDVPAPLISSVTPAHAAPGTSVMVLGSEFCQQPEVSDDPLACLHVGQVLFGVTTGSVSLYTDTAITVDVPGATGALQVFVTSAGRTSNGFDFAIDP